jgi:hypothetical protein
MIKNKSYKLYKNIYSVGLFFLFLFLFYTSSCIQRINPNDPIFNKSISKCSPDSINAFRDSVKSILQKNADTVTMTMSAFNDTLSLLDLKKRNRLDSNTLVLNSNFLINELNNNIEFSNNNQKSIDSLATKIFFDTLISLQLDFSLRRNLLSSRIIDSINLLSMFTLACPNISDSFEDSTWRIFSQNTLPVGTMNNSIALMRQSYDSANAEILGFNILIVLQNSLIQSYNDSIDKKKWVYKTRVFPHITSGESLKSLVANAIPGDTFLIEGPCSLKGNWNLTSMHGSATDHISLIGNPWSENILIVEGGIFIDSSEYLDISNVTIKNSRVSGIKLENRSNNITLNNCTFENNYGYGIDVVSSGISVNNCVILKNGGGGIQFAPQPTNFRMDLNNVLIAKNNGKGIDAITPFADLKFVTISNNNSDGVHIVSPTGSNVSIFNCIISFNSGYGIYKTEGNPNGIIQFGLLDLYQNALGDISHGIDGSFMNVDPGYTDTTYDNFSTLPTSIIYKYQTEQNTIIGYR